MLEANQIILVPEKSITSTIKILKDAGYPPHEIKNILIATGKHVQIKDVKKILKEPVLPEDLFDIEEAVE